MPSILHKFPARIYPNPTHCVTTQRSYASWVATTYSHETLHYGPMTVKGTAVPTPLCTSTARAILENNQT